MLADFLPHTLTDVTPQVGGEAIMKKIITLKKIRDFSDFEHCHKICNNVNTQFSKTHNKDMIIFGHLSVAILHFVSSSSMHTITITITS